MTSLFFPNDGFQPLHDLVICRAATQQRSQVVLHHAEEARPDFAIGRQPQPVTMATEWFADGSYDSDLPTAVPKSPAFGCR